MITDNSFNLGQIADGHLVTTDLVSATLIVHFVNDEFVLALLPFSLIIY